MNSQRRLSQDSPNSVLEHTAASFGRVSINVLESVTIADRKMNKSEASYLPYLRS